jgi:hypothetical protein
MDHDQNFKNLILDYPRQALALFAEAEAGALSEDVRITPIRQEQLKEVGGQCLTLHLFSACPLEALHRESA